MEISGVTILTNTANKILRPDHDIAEAFVTVKKKEQKDRKKRSKKKLEKKLKK